MKDYSTTTRELYNKWLRHIRCYNGYMSKVRFGMKDTAPEVLHARDEFKLVEHSQAMLKARAPLRDWDYRRLTSSPWNKEDRYEHMRWVYARLGWVDAKRRLEQWDAVIGANQNLKEAKMTKNESITPAPVDERLPFPFKNLAASKQMLVLIVAAEIIEMGSELADVEYYAYLEYQEALSHLEEDEEPEPEDIDRANANIEEYITDLNAYQKKIRNAFNGDGGTAPTANLLPFLDYVTVHWTTTYQDIYLSMLAKLEGLRDKF